MFHPRKRCVINFGSRPVWPVAVREAKTPLGPKQIADITPTVSYDTIRHLLPKMVASGDVTRSGSGKYIAA